MPGTHPTMPTSPITRLAAAIWLLALLNPAQAGLENKLNEYYSSLGGAASVSPANLYQGQSAGYFSGGGIRVRAPVSNYNLLSFQAPKLQYGCSGIDAFLGGFSFINKEQLIAMARQIGSTAVSTAFYLALDSMSPELSALMKQLQEWANNANRFNINSCEAGTRMGASIWRNLGGDKSDFCKRVKTGSGVLSDEFSAKLACDTDGWDFSWLPGTDPNRDEEVKLKQMVAGNVVWRALKSAGINDNELGELVMSVTGSVIIPQGDSRNPQQARAVESTMTYQEVIDGVSSFRMLKCDEYSECLNPTVVTYNNDQRMARIRERVEKGIAHIIKAVGDLSGTTDIASCTSCPHTMDALTVIELSEYPIVALIQAEHDAGMDGSGVAREYQELLIREVTYRFFAKAATPLATALANDGEAVAGTEGMRARLADHLHSVLALAQQAVSTELLRKGGLDAVLGVYMQLKRMATARYSPSLTQRLRLAQVLRR